MQKFSFICTGISSTHLCWYPKLLFELSNNNPEPTSCLNNFIHFLHPQFINTKLSLNFLWILCPSQFHFQTIIIILFLLLLYWKALSYDCAIIPCLRYDNAQCKSPFASLVCGDSGLALYRKGCSFLIITQYLIISLPCLSQCLIGLLVTFPLH